MRLQFNDLAKHLKQGLSSLYCIAGEEPYLRHQISEALRQQALSQGLTSEDIERWDLNANFKWQDFFNHLKTGSLFSKKRFIECHLTENRLGQETEEALRTVFKLTLTDTVLVLVLSPENPAFWKSTLFGALERQSICIMARPLSQHALISLLKQRFQAYNLKVTDSAINAILIATEGNLTASLQVVEKLKLYYQSELSEHGQVDPEVVEALVSCNSNYVVFELVNAAMMGPLSRMTRIFTQLKHTGSPPALILWALTQKIRTLAMQATDKKSAYYRLLSQAKTLDAEIKTGLSSPFEKLFDLYLLFSGVQNNEENHWTIRWNV